MRHWYVVLGAPVSAIVAAMREPRYSFIESVPRTVDGLTGAALALQLARTGNVVASVRTSAGFGSLHAPSAASAASVVAASAAALKVCVIVDAPLTVAPWSATPTTPSSSSP